MAGGVGATRDRVLQGTLDAWILLHTMWVCDLIHSPIQQTWQSQNRDVGATFQAKGRGSNTGTPSPPAFPF